MFDKDYQKGTAINQEGIQNWALRNYLTKLIMEIVSFEKIKD